MNVFVADTRDINTWTRGARRKRRSVISVENQDILHGFARQRFAETIRNYGKQGQKKGVRKLDERAEEGSKYAFGVRIKKEINVVNGKCVNAAVGGIVLDLLINSGASCNIIDEETWKWRKSQNIKCMSRKTDEKKIYAYGQNEALELLGEFDFDIEIGNRKSRATFLVLKGKGKHF